MKSKSLIFITIYIVCALLVIILGGTYLTNVDVKDLTPVPDTAEGKLLLSQLRENYTYDDFYQ